MDTAKYIERIEKLIERLKSDRQATDAPLGDRADFEAITDAIENLQLAIECLKDVGKIDPEDYDE